jgi:hypothetical protein
MVRYMHDQAHVFPMKMMTKNLNLPRKVGNYLLKLII